MEVELNISLDLHSNKGDKSKIIKRNAIQRIALDIENIGLVKELFTRTGNVDTKYCLVFIKDIGEVVVNHPYEYIKELKIYKGHRIGFKYTNRDKELKINNDGKSRKKEKSISRC